jgi:hypothetical protein
MIPFAETCIQIQEKLGAQYLPEWMWFENGPNLGNTLVCHGHVQIDATAYFICHPDGVCHGWWTGSEGLGHAFGNARGVFSHGCHSQGDPVDTTLDPLGLSLSLSASLSLSLSPRLSLSRSLSLSLSPSTSLSLSLSLSLLLSLALSLPHTHTSVTWTLALPFQHLLG